MAGIEDTPEGGETRRYGNTIGVPHTESDDTRLENAAIEPGSVVGIDDSGNLAKADANAGIEVIGVLVNYPVYGASHQGEQIKGDVDATVAVQGTYAAQAVSGAVSPGDLAGVADTSKTGEEAGRLVSGSEYRIVDVDDTPPMYDMVEVVL
jgi:hypothetical protein